MYPRNGARLVPRALAPAIGRQRIGPSMLARLGLPPCLRLEELDEGVWEELGDEAISTLAYEVVRQVRRRWSEIERVETVVPFVGKALADLELSNRARNGIIRHRRPRDAALPDTTVGELAQIPGFGAHCLLDVLTAVDDGPLPTYGGVATATTQGDSGAKPSRSVRRAARDLARRRWTGRVSRNDPRLGGLVQELDDEARTALEAANRAADRLCKSGEGRRLLAAIKALTAEATRIRRLSLDEELEEVVGAVLKTPTSRSMATARLGLGGLPPVTLEAAGRAAGVTRERVRQVEKSFRDAVEPADEVWTPALDRVLRVIREMSPTTVEQLRRSLIERELTPPDFSIRSIFAAADVFGKAIEIDIKYGLVASHALPITPDKVHSAARRLVTHWGATTIDEVCAELGEQQLGTVSPDLVTLVLEPHEQFRWLDQPRGWFWLRGTARNRLLNQIEKVMSVAGSLPIGDLRDGVGRHHRMRGFRPPREVLARLCEDSGLYERRDDLIVEKPGLADWQEVLGKNEATLVELLFDHGPAMRRDDLETLAVERGGLNRSSFYVYLGYSPVIARYAPGVYGLRGARVTAAEVDAMIPPKARTQVLQDHGWTSDGELWIAYRVSAAGERSAVLGVPGAVKAVVHGSFELATEDGRAIGTLVVEGNMWGLSPFYRRYGIEEGDYIVLVLDLQARTATIHAGAPELLLRFQAGE